MCKWALSNFGITTTTTTSSSITNNNNNNNNNKKQKIAKISSLSKNSLNSDHPTERPPQVSSSRFHVRTDDTINTHTRTHRHTETHRARKMLHSNGLATMRLLAVMLALTYPYTAHGFDIGKLQPIADRNIQTGNKMLYEREHEPMNETQMTASEEEQFLEVNSIPVRYDEMQLWRIYNISDDMRQNMAVADTLEHKYGGILWKENSKFLDISFGKAQLKAARSFLDKHKLVSVVLNRNVQDLIDDEQLLGVQATQSVAGRRTKKATRSGIHWKDYHDLDVIYAFMREIRAKFPNICRLYSIGKSAEGRDLKVLRISENPQEYKKIWIDGGIHAREWISPATVTYILYQLMANWENQPRYMKERTWYFMPVMNPDGYVYSRKVNRLWRKNRAPAKRSKCVGVDLNRNFDIGWSGAGSSTNPCSDTYRGTKPGSELETKAVVEFLSKRKFNLESYLTFHSYGQMMVYPWAYKAVKIKDSSDLQEVANAAVLRIKQKTGKLYGASVTHAVLGIAGGGSDDWTRAALGTKYVYTLEMRDRGQYGFVLPPKQILQTAMEGYIIVETVAEAITLE